MDPPDDTDQKEINANSQSSFPWFYILVLVCLGMGIFFILHAPSGFVPPG